MDSYPPQAHLRAVGAIELDTCLAYVAAVGARPWWVPRKLGKQEEVFGPWLADHSLHVVQLSNESSVSWFGDVDWWAGEAAT